MVWTTHLEHDAFGESFPLGVVQMGRRNKDDREFYKFIQIWNASTSKKQVMNKLSRGMNYVDAMFGRAVALGVLMREFHTGHHYKFKESYEFDFQEPVPCSEATLAARGSFDKVVVLRQRVERGEELWHPEDSPMFAQPNESFVRVG